MALIHGGQLNIVAEKYKIPVNNWLDLSTGIAPISYPIPEIPLTVWQQLPQKNVELIKAAKHYYKCPSIMVTNGSQSIIKVLPKLWGSRKNTRQDNSFLHNKKGTVYLPERGYKEHAESWKLAGYQCCFYQDHLPEVTSLEKNSVLVVINPNNPTGKLFTQTALKHYQQTLKALNGLLVIDEAFMDVIEPTESMSGLVNDEHLLVLRSFGKFFGLAGIRIGFLVANSFWQDKFLNELGPWQVNGPAQYIATIALQDTDWQRQQKTQLKQLQQKQVDLLWNALGKTIIASITGTTLFLTLTFHEKDNAKIFYHGLCQQGIYSRLSDEQDTIRFGIAAHNDFTRLFNGLSHLT